MGLLNAISNWQTNRQRKHHEKMESLGMCPDCYGKGHIVSASMEYPMSYDCTGCNGSGLYEDWRNNQ